MERSNEIADKIRNFILNRFPIARQQAFTDDVSLLDTGIVDSLGILDIVNFLQEEFEVVISDEELLPEIFKSVQTLFVLVEKKIGK